MGNLLTIISLLAVMAATAMPLLGLNATAPIAGFGIWRYIYAAGSLLLLITKIVWPQRENDLRRRRLARLQFWAGIILCVGAFFIFYAPYANDWLAFTMAGAFLQAYSSIMLSRKESRKA